MQEMPIPPTIPPKFHLRFTVRLEEAITIAPACGEVGTVVDRRNQLSPG
jgi:hypothetical protein